MRYICLVAVVAPACAARNQHRPDITCAEGPKACNMGVEVLASSDGDKDTIAGFQRAARPDYLSYAQQGPARAPRCSRMRLQ